ncbi:MAG: ATP-grasp domain-containing protein [Thermoanaerobaculia bacterium]
MDVALATSSDLIGLDPDDAPLVEALSREGLSIAPVAWDDPHFDWSSAGICLIRSTWDYHLRLPEFLAWVERADSLTRLWNPPATVRWNGRKTYLRELASAGIPVVETVWLAPGDADDLSRIAGDRGWSEIVVKPVVSAGARDTLHVRRDDLEEGRRHLAALLRRGEAMVQPYLDSVEGYGERCVVWIDGQITHSVRKRPILRRSGDDWVEADSAQLDPEESTLATRAIAASGRDALYARVDLVRDGEGRSRVLELEMIEPTLFFVHCRPAAARLASAVSREALRRRASSRPSGGRLPP